MGALAAFCEVLPEDPFSSMLPGGGYDGGIWRRTC